MFCVTLNLINLFSALATTTIHGRLKLKGKQWSMRRSLCTTPDQIGNTPNGAIDDLDEIGMSNYCE